MLACDDLLRQAYADAGQVLRAQPADLDHDAEKIFVKHRPDESVTFAAARRSATPTRTGTPSADR